MEVPEYDSFTVTMGIIYAAFIGVSALVLTDRRWSWWIVSVLVLLLLSLGISWYYPVVVSARIRARAMGPVGWLEGSIYTGLLFVTGFVCILNLLGARLEGSER
jgi:hypothetical protein